jgi:hypothetical protein
MLRNRRAIRRWLHGRAQVAPTWSNARIPLLIERRRRDCLRSAYCARDVRRVPATVEEVSLQFDVEQVQSSVHGLVYDRLQRCGTMIKSRNGRHHDGPHLHNLHEKPQVPQVQGRLVDQENKPPTLLQDYVCGPQQEVSEYEVAMPETVMIEQRATIMAVAGNDPEEIAAAISPVR